MFWSWIFTAFIESIVLSVLPLYTLTNSDIQTANQEIFMQAGATCLTAVVIVVNLKVRISFALPQIMLICLFVFSFSTDVFLAKSMVFWKLRDCYCFDWCILSKFILHNEFPNPGLQLLQCQWFLLCNVKYFNSRKYRCGQDWFKLEHFG